MSALRIPWYLTLAVVAVVAVVALALLWEGIPWQVLALMATFTAAMVATVSG